MKLIGIERTATTLVMILVAVLSLAGTGRAATGELEQARTIGKRTVALFKTPAGLCKLGTLEGIPCTAKERAELAQIFKYEINAAEFRAISLKALRQVAPHRFRLSLGTLFGEKAVFTLRRSNGRWQLLSEDKRQWNTIPAWLAG